MKNKSPRFQRYLTNNFSYDKSDMLYRKVYLLNTVLIIMSIVSSSFVVIDIMLFKMYDAALINAAAVIMTIFTYIFFKKTNKYIPAAYMSVIILIICLISFFEMTQNKHYAFYWLSIVSPIVYFLLEKNPARIVLGLFGSYMIYFVITKSAVWQPAEFDAQSVFNILGASISLVFMIAYYERSRKEAQTQLNNTILLLTESRNDLHLILDSSAEAIYGIDLEGNCTFCNKSCLNMLGYKDQNELLGKNMHRLIHYKHRDGSIFHVRDSKIYSAFLNGNGVHLEDEVFWRKDGTCFDVEYFSYPQIKNGEISGAVITFMDISERRQKEAQIQYLNYHDTLTGLHNRRFFEESRRQMDIPENLPLSVIFADINGLKMTNDIFGHSTGDKLIVKSSEILSNMCNNKDVVMRIGGDEFIIFLPNKAKADCIKILEGIESGFRDAKIEAIRCSISLGCDTKVNQEQSLEDIMVNAENLMYKDKTMNRKSRDRDTIDAIIETLHFKSPGEKQHSIAVSSMCQDLGEALQLSETQIRKLKRIGYLHDIGKIVLDEDLMNKNDLSAEELIKIQQHTIIGYKILNLFDATLDLSEYVYAHHERWDGTGYPRGLKNDQIPLFSRIISIVECYHRALTEYDSVTDAIADIKNGEGKKFDSYISDIFIKMIEEKE